MSQPPVKRNVRGAGPPRRPEDSVFYSRLVPALLIGLGVLMVVMIGIAVAIALGWVAF